MSPLIIDHEIEHFLEDQEGDIRAGRFTIESYQQYLAWQAMPPEEVREQARPQVEHRLKRAHVLREVARQQEIEATDAEIDEEVESIAEGSGDQADEVRKLFAEQERRESLRRALINRKAIAHLTAIAEQTDDTGKPKAKRAPAKRAAAAKRKTKAPAKSGV